MDIHRRSPKDFANLRNMAAMYEKLGDYKKALALYLKVSEALSPEQREKDKNLKQAIDRLKGKPTGR